MEHEKEVKKEAGESVEFHNCDKIGDTINALVKHFTNYTLGDFILTQALEKVKENNKKVEKFVTSFIKEE